MLGLLVLTLVPLYSSLSLVSLNYSSVLFSTHIASLLHLLVGRATDATDMFRLYKLHYTTAIGGITGWRHPVGDKCDQDTT